MTLLIPPKRVVFFNHYHNGDIHISREFVRKIMGKVKALYPDTTFAYSHLNARELLADLPELAFDETYAVKKLKPHQGIFRSQDTVYLNTWYCQQDYKHFRQHHITIDCLYACFEEHCRNVWGFSLAEISKDSTSWFETIDYSAFPLVQNIDAWLLGRGKKLVFISNGAILSKQAAPFSFQPIISNLAQKYPDIDFILSNQEDNLILPNVFFSRDIIKSRGCDLNENGYLAARCDIVIGRASGAFTFAQTQETFFKPGPKFICFSNLPSSNGFWLGQKFKQVKYANPFLTFNLSDPQLIQNIIEKHL